MILKRLSACVPEQRFSQSDCTGSTVQICSPGSPKAIWRTRNGKQDGGLKRHLLFLFAFFFHLSETFPFFLPLLPTHHKDRVCLYLYGEQQGMNLECFIKGCQSQPQ